MAKTAKSDTVIRGRTNLYSRYKRVLTPTPRMWHIQTDDVKTTKFSMVGEVPYRLIRGFTFRSEILHSVNTISVV